MSDEKAKRFNDGKVDLTLLPEVAAYEECKVWMAGMDKYDRDNWRKLWGTESVTVANASLLRHALALSSGELFDQESGLPHAAHIRCNAAMILEHMANEKMITPKLYKRPTKDTEKEEEMVEVEYQTRQAHYGGGEIYFQYRTVIPKSQLEEFTQTHESVRVLSDTETDYTGSLFSGGKL